LEKADDASRPPRRWALAIILSAIGLYLVVGGAQLLRLGGSAYYLLAGAFLLGESVVLFRRSRFGPLLYALFLLGTFAWAVAEVGLEPWGLLARLGGPVVLGLWFVLPGWWRAARRAPRRAGLVVLGLGVVALAAYGGLRSLQPSAPAEGVGPVLTAGPPTDWTAYGGTERATRYSPLTQITPQNVGRLKLAWTYRTGDLPAAADAQTAWTFEATPLKVGDTLYLCTAHSIVHAIDAETGRRRWVFNPNSRNAWAPLRACRGVAFYRATRPVADCPERVVVPTGDDRLVALDARTGRPCASFGRNGEVSLLEGLGRYPPGYSFATSPPAVIDGKLVIGGFVMDGAKVAPPSGVIRAYDAVTGQLAWAWDMGRPDRIGPPGPGETYTPGTPNAWPPFSADADLGLVYVPLGNATPDFFAAHRSPEAEAYGSSVVALEVKTGRPVWRFQIDHHDLWDHDLPAQPTLIDFPTARGPIPALVQPTKRGELFVLDRRTGTPLTAVVEKPVPQGAAAGDHTARTQPYSVGMPSFAGPDLSEAGMWGMTPLDQLWCRIRFRELRYEGQFTPPSVQGSISYPGSAGVFSWGGVAVDEGRAVLIANTVRSPFVTRLIPRKIADTMGLSTAPNTAGANASSRGGAERAAGAHAGLPQVGTPYAAQAMPFLSPLAVPCVNPPWGEISAVDLATRKLLWKKPFGTSSGNGPFGWRHGLPLSVGVPSAGGALSLKSGIFMIGGTPERYLRAYETRTGRELWRARLPAGGQATPMTYVSGPSGRQFVVIAAGGHGGLGGLPGDYVLAYALR